MSPSKRSSPNILWLMSDQHHADCMGCAGHPNVKTPHLDSLAAEGIRFNRAYCNNPICGPSRICFLTGTYLNTHRISGNEVHGHQGEAPLNLARHFRLGGYQTALIGKAHLPVKWLKEGFEHLSFSDLADSKPDDPLSVDYFKYLVNHGLGDLYDQGTRSLKDPEGTMRAFVSDLPYEHSLEHWTGNSALSFLKDRESSRPFFLQVSFQRPHDPVAPSPGHANLYDPGEIILPDSASDFLENGFAGKPECVREAVSGERGQGAPYLPLHEADLKRQVAHYLALVTAVDSEIGRVIAHLKKTGEYENTVIVYHSDHGDFAGDHGLQLKNIGMYESIHRIPFLLKAPGGPKGIVDSRLVESVDLFPTLCELAGLVVPSECEGVALPLFVENKAPEKEFVIGHHQGTGNGAMGAVMAVRTRDFRLVYYPRSGEGELYDHRSDSGECDNRFEDPALQETREYLLRCILKHLAMHAWNKNAPPTGPANMNTLLQRSGRLWSELEPFMRKR